ncbi:ARF-GAP domain 6 [Actinidia rufa]|uniref:ARF-GAP domain 6 n=1 Tax=Actinidia rufa TaxID=165716 RepID=A0A7J0GJQ0_9ERIC|nr:ARF-GAP domain 6 [Actinidia rufa]
MPMTAREDGYFSGEGGYDTKVNETVNVVTAKTTEIGQKTWGIMKGVMALASKKVEEYTKDGVSWKADGWQQNGSENNGYYQNFSQESKGLSSGGGQPSSGAHINSVSSGSWDDWNQKDNRKGESTKVAASSNGDGWAGWDDAKDDEYDDFQSASNKTAVGHNGKSDTKWTDGGFL